MEYDEGHQQQHRIDIRRVDLSEDEYMYLRSLLARVLDDEYDKWMDTFYKTRGTEDKSRFKQADANLELIEGIMRKFEVWKE